MLQDDCLAKYNNLNYTTARKIDSGKRRELAMEKTAHPDLSELNYYDTDKLGETQAIVVGMVPVRRKVLEIGSGSGIISKALLETKESTVTAVDLHPSDLLISRVERCIQADLNQENWHNIFETGEKFDVIVAADVLEHLYDPWSALKSLKNLLSQGGSIIISLPNSTHTSMVAALLCGDINYQNEGLLDKTHIRFFGLKNIKELHKQAGLKIIQAEFVLKYPEHTEMSFYWKKLSYSQKNSLSGHPLGLVYQVVIKSVPDSEPSYREIDILSMPVAIQRKTYMHPTRAKLLKIYGEFLCSIAKFIRFANNRNKLAIKLDEKLNELGSLYYRKSLENDRID